MSFKIKRPKRNPRFPRSIPEDYLKEVVWGMVVECGQQLGPPPKDLAEPTVFLCTLLVVWLSVESGVPEEALAVTVPDDEIRSRCLARLLECGVIRQISNGNMQVTHTMVHGEPQFPFTRIVVT